MGTVGSIVLENASFAVRVKPNETLKIIILLIAVSQNSDSEFIFCLC